MRSKRKRYDAAFKAKVALEAIKGEQMISEIASKTGVHPNQISKWNKQALEELSGIFYNVRKKHREQSEELESELYKQIGQLKVELDWLKKNLGCSTKKKRLLVDRSHRWIAVYRQYKLICLARSSYYYRTKRPGKDDRPIMRLID